MWNTIVIQPLSNALLVFVGFFGGSVFWAVVIMTLLVKIILFPLAYKAFKSQRQQQLLAPLVRDVKKKYPDSKEQNVKLMELYKEHKANPFSGCLVLLIQLPILIGIYQVFLHGMGHAGGLAYHFVSVPVTISDTIFGISLSSPSIIIGILAGLTQLVQVLLSPVFKTPAPSSDGTTSFEERMTNSMQGSMKWSMPIMMGVIGSIIPSAVSVYLVVSNIVTIFQEWIFLRMEKRSNERNLVKVPS